MRAPPSRGGVERAMNQKRAGPEPLVAVPGQLKCVLGGVLLSRTLAGAVPSALSGLASGFGMGSGRFPVAVTTETTVRAVHHRLVWCGYSVVRNGCPHHARVCVVGRGGLGVDRIVDARVLTCFTHPPVWGWLLFVLAY